MVSSYYKKWYNENKERRNRKRRLRYQNDPVYRAQQKAMSKNLYERQKKGKALNRKEYRLINVTTKDGQVKPLRVYTVGYLANFIDRTMQTIKNWENNGIMPVSPIRINKWRLYTFKMIQDVASALKRRNGIVSEEYKGKGFMEEISTKWENALNKYDPESLVQDY